MNSDSFSNNTLMNCEYILDTDFNIPILQILPDGGHTGKMLIRVSLARVKKRERGWTAVFKLVGPWPRNGPVLANSRNVSSLHSDVPTVMDYVLVLKMALKSLRSGHSPKEFMVLSTLLLLLLVMPYERRSCPIGNKQCNNSVMIYLCTPINSVIGLIHSCL